MKIKYLIRNSSAVLSFALLAVVFTGCSPESKATFSSMGSSILNSVGVNVSGSQLSNVIDAGEKINAATRGLSNEQEFYLGRAVSAAILHKYPLSNNGQATRYANKVGRTLASYSPRPNTFTGYHFAILDSNELNAVSAPSGFVFVTKGFISQLSDEDSLAAVLAHEIAHVALGHGTAAISQSNITSALTILGKDAASMSGNAIAQELVGPFSDSVGQVVETLLVNGYSRSQEYEADLLAVNILQKAGYQQAAMLTVLKTLEGHAAQGGGWTDTHPSPEKRIDELEDEVKIAALDAGSIGYSVRKARFAKNIK